ncbi:MAG TPA: DNA mismatch repair protein MutT [Firmicutes bacterium]|nr:DNA mismatch repair protein MutT [Bacillota bacterium]
MPEVLLLNMCMIIDEKQKRVLVQDKVKTKVSDWGGITFPGGHVEALECLIDSTIREVFEETGLTIRDLTHSGIVHWEHTDNQKRWLIFLYKTSTYSGTLLDQTEEGKVYWVPVDELLNQPLAPDMLTYLKLFFNDELNEAYATWNGMGNSAFILR